MTLADLMTPSPFTIAPGATLRDAVELLTRVGVSALPVMEGGRLIGLLSAQNLIAFEAITPGVPTQRDVSDVWDEAAPAEDELPSVEYFAELWDDAGGDVAERFRQSETPEWDFLSEHTVDEAMMADPPQLPSSAAVVDAAELMRRTGCHGVLVVDRGALSGIVTTMDITRTFGRRGRAVRKA
jgi:CBS domain-containing protein